MNPKVDWYFQKEEKWQNEVAKMREIVLDCNLKEELKWGCPAYTFEKKNIVLIHVFKDYCAFLFFKGALMKDPNGILIQQTENVQAARQVRFTNLEQIVQLENELKKYIFHAVEVEVSGAKVEMKKTKDFPVPLELEEVFKQKPNLKEAFEKLSPGRQRAYLMHFGQAKQSSTRISRIEKCTESIMNGKGWNE